jgi:ATP-dependent DNA helicase RecQ
MTRALASIQSLTEMGQISGIGQAKLKKYGDEFLQVLEDKY